MSNMFCPRPPRHGSCPRWAVPLPRAGVASVFAPACDCFDWREGGPGKIVISYAMCITSFSQVFAGSRGICCARVLRRLGHFEIAEQLHQLIS